MLPVVCATILVLFVVRFALTERTAATGVHPRDLTGVAAGLDEAGSIEDRENYLVFARGLVAEKSMVLDNALALVNFRKYANGGEEAERGSEDVDARLAEYAEMIGRMDREVERSSAEAARLAGGASAGDEASPSSPVTSRFSRGAPLRYAHFVGMLALALLAAALVTFE
jgi:hypothetical protein